MRKFFLKKKSISHIHYWPLEQGYSMSFDLSYLWEMFDPFRDWISKDKYEDGLIEIWCYWDVKDKARRTFSNDQERINYDNAYKQYNNKRFAEIPMIKLTQENYDAIIEQWKTINAEAKTEYLVIFQNDNGVISFILQNELSQNDLAYIEQDFKKYDDYIKKYEIYLKKHHQAKEWSCSKDNDFFSDFLTPEEMPWLFKKK